jgi:hypothetical protein
MWLWARARQDDLLTHPALGLRAVTIIIISTDQV